MNPVLAALSAGYGEEELLQFISKAIPSVSPKIKKAKSAGHSIANILNFIGNTMESDEFDPTLNESEAHARQKRKQEAFTKGLFKTGAIAGLGALATRAIPPALQAVQKALKKAPASPSVGPAPMSNAPTAAPEIPKAVSPEATARAASAETLNAVTPEFQQWANQQLGQGNEKPLAVLLREFQQQKEQEQSQQAIAKATADLQQQKQTNPVSPLNFKKGSVVATPAGQSGFLKDFRQKEALIDEDGKIHKVKKEDLVEIPENVAKKDYQSIAKHYFDTFPKEGEGSLSDALSVMAYDPDTRQLVAAFPDSPHLVYVYDNVEPELYEEVISASTSPKTSGGTGVPGVWDVNVADSRGSPFKKISGNKERYPFKKLNVGYNMFGKLADAIKEMRKQSRRKK